MCEVTYILQINNISSIIFFIDVSTFSLFEADDVLKIVLIFFHIWASMFL